jgi:hypothetical protein
VGALLVSGGAEPRLEVPLRITAVRPAAATAPP